MRRFIIVGIILAAFLAPLYFFVAQPKQKSPVMQRAEDEEVASEKKNVDTATDSEKIEEIKMTVRAIIANQKVIFDAISAQGAKK